MNLGDLAVGLLSLGVGGAVGAAAGLVVAARRVLDQSLRVEASLAELAGRPEAQAVRAELSTLRRDLEALRRAADLVGRAFRRR